jgi:hypothetical protein
MSRWLAEALLAAHLADHPDADVESCYLLKPNFTAYRVDTEGYLKRYRGVAQPHPTTQPKGRRLSENTDSLSITS